MTERFKALYNRCLSDTEFISEADKLEEDRDWLQVTVSDETGRHLLAMCYWGWLIAKGKAKEVKENLPPKK